ncbi:phospholipid-transporting ATPase ABCA3-like [Haemaphysalis longicornis]
MDDDRGQRTCLWARQLHVIIWKNIYLKRVCRHYAATLIEAVLMVVLLLGIQEDSVVREPLIRRTDTVYQPAHPRQFWNTQPDMARISTVYYTPENRYINSLIREAFARLGVSHVEAVPTEQQLVTIARELANATPPARAVALKFWGFVENGTDERPAHLHASLFTGPLPFDIQLHYPEWLIAQPEGPVKEEQFPEVNTLLPIMAALQQRDLELQALRFAYPYPLPPVKLQRFPYPEHIEHKDTKNYALVLTRFCIGMLIPFSVFVARLAEEKSTGMKELMRLSGLNDWLYWGSHYLTAFVIHVAISTIMMLFVSVKRNEEGRPFILYSDPTLVFWILMCFCSSSIMHAMLLSMFFASPQSAVAGAMLYWTIFCSMPFLALEHDYGHGYHYIKRRDKLLTSVFPGMSLHWSFRVLERFEKFAEHGANWVNFYDVEATPDDITLAEIVLVNLLADCFIIFCIWYLDNVHPGGPAISKPYLYLFKSLDIGTEELSGFSWVPFGG